MRGAIEAEQLVDVQLADLQLTDLQLADLQLTKLRALVAAVETSNPFYADKLRRAGVGSSLSSLQDFILPGGASLTMMDAAFSSYQDLVSHFKYVNPS